MATVKGDHKQPDLSADTVSVLLGGWGAKPVVDDGRHGFGGGFIELLDGDAAMAALWTRHERYLRAKAREWGWHPDDGGMFYAERLAAEGETTR